MKRNKVKIIYIAGLGHSGSTLFDAILGTSKKTISVGELKNFYEYAKNENIADPKLNRIINCDCGKRLQDCKFWSEIVKKININNLIPMKTSFKKKVFTLKYIFFNSDKNKNKTEEGKLYRLIIDSAKKNKSKKVEYIVDSSKNLRNLVQINKCKELDIIVLHLIRDCRGVVNSYRKMKVNWFDMYFQWVLNNFLISFYNRKNKNYIKISYDYFANNPEKIIEKINKKLDLSLSKNIISSINKEEYHTIAGNQIVIEVVNNKIVRKEFKGIKYDQSWKTQMPKYQQYILNVLCYIPNKLWVYNEKNEK